MHKESKPYGVIMDEMDHEAKYSSDQPNQNELLAKELDALFSTLKMGGKGNEVWMANSDAETIRKAAVVLRTAQSTDQNELLAEALAHMHRARLASIRAATIVVRLRNVIHDTIEALERNSTSAPVVECLKAALAYEPDAEIKPHIYMPDLQAMGDCRVCGHEQNSPYHVPPLRVAPAQFVAENELLAQRIERQDVEFLTDGELLRDDDSELICKALRAASVPQCEAEQGR